MQDTCSRTTVVTSRLHYGNALLYGLPHLLTVRLQQIHNLLVVSLLVRSLVTEFEVLLFTNYDLNGLTPDYLAESISYRPV